MCWTRIMMMKKSDIMKKLWHLEVNKEPYKTFNNND